MKLNRIRDFSGRIRWGSSLYLQIRKGNWICFPDVAKPEIRFDRIAGDNCMTYKTIAPKVYQAQCTTDAKPHHAQFSPCGTKLSLLASDE